MKTSIIIAMAGAILIAGSLFGGDLVSAFPTSAPAAGAQTPRVPYQWNGGRAAAVLPAGTPCPARRSLTLGWDGPRLKWQRDCSAG